MPGKGGSDTVWGGHSWARATPERSHAPGEVVHRRDLKHACAYEPGEALFEKKCQPVTPRPPSQSFTALEEGGGRGCTNVKISLAPSVPPSLPTLPPSGGEGVGWDLGWFQALNQGSHGSRIVWTAVGQCPPPPTGALGDAREAWVLGMRWEGALGPGGPAGGGEWRRRSHHRPKIPAQPPSGPYLPPV